MSGLSLPGGGVPHTFGDAVMIAADISVSGHEQKERTCRNCGAVRVTVLAPGFSWREWRAKADGPQGSDAPRCPQIAEVAP